VAKILLDKNEYDFVASTKKITIKTFDVIFDIKDILLIRNVTSTKEATIFTGAIGKSGAILNNVLTLDFDTTSMADTDDLQIYINYIKASQKVELIDNDVFTSFGRIRTAESKSLFDGQFKYDERPESWRTKTVGTASITHLPNEMAIDMNIGTASGDKVIRQSDFYIPYQSGTSPIIRETFLFKIGKPNLRQEVGLFDDENGFILRKENNTISFIIRDFLTGTQNELVKQRSSWNDPMDGTGRSKINLDFSLTQHLVIDFQALYVGRVRFGFDIGGRTINAHDEDFANRISTAYISTATLPIRYQITNLGATSSASSMKQICSSYQAEGGDPINDTVGDRYLINSTTSGVSVGSSVEVPLFSIRPQASFKGQKFRGIIIPEELTTYAKKRPFRTIIRLNPILSGAVWTNYSETSSACQLDTSASTISGGKLLGVLDSDKKTTKDLSKLLEKHFLSTDIDGLVPDVLSVSSISLAASTNVLYSFKHKEIK